MTNYKVLILAFTVICLRVGHSVVWNMLRRWLYLQRGLTIHEFCIKVFQQLR